MPDDTITSTPFEDEDKLNKPFEVDRLNDLNDRLDQSTEFKRGGAEPPARLLLQGKQGALDRLIRRLPPGSAALLKQELQQANQPQPPSAPAPTPGGPPVGALPQTPPTPGVPPPPGAAPGGAPTGGLPPQLLAQMLIPLLRQSGGLV